jgi:hypothetical protein
MSCPNPSCSGISRVTLAPGFFRCTSQIVERIWTGAHPSGAFGPAYRDISYPCGFEYQEGTGQAGQQVCQEHSLFAVGVCARCKANPVCGRCPLQKCLSCRKAEQRAETERQRVVAARLNAERAAAVEQNAREQNTRRAEHEARVKANAARYPMPRSFYLNKLNKLRRKTFRDHRHFSQTKAITAMVIFALLPSPLLAAVVAGKAPAVLWLIVEAMFLLIGSFLNAGGLRTIYASSQNARLRTEQEALLRALGCGSDCEFGCRSGVAVWALTLFPRGFDQVIPQVLAVFLF